MHFFTYALLLAAMLLALLASVGARAESSDTYNFYFQKAPGPVTVNQGAAPAPAGTAPIGIVAPQTSAAAGTSISVTSAPEPSAERKHLYFTLGYAITANAPEATTFQLASGAKDNYLSGQYALKAEYDVLDRLALTGEAYLLRRNVTYNRIWYNRSTGLVLGQATPATDAPDGGTAKTVLDYSAGAAFHVVKLQSTTFSLIGGIATVPKLHYSTDPSEGDSIAADEPGGVQHENTFYAGARLRLIADNVWGLDVSYKAMIGRGFGVAQAGLTFAL